ncbi:DUF1878 family protein [Neobacillus notoginsengisoli]|uniref:DUF1878 family protein n=1 Tax=Neobacillus notoginsengisoli TaxID=1578198 RepID=UPI0013146409|nr:DUF1878 family protein [Neobacillus notoginsengisoli]
MERIEMLEYHMRLTAEALDRTPYELNKLVIANKLSEKEAGQFFTLCEKMHKLMEEQKAEGFLNFHPLFNEFSSLLTPKLNPEEVVLACIKQQLFLPLMNEFKKFI